MRATLILCAVLASAHAIKKPTIVANSTNLNAGMSNYELLVKRIHEECKVLCVPEDAGVHRKVDSHCVTECEVEMFRCHDHNHTTVVGKPAYEACEKAAAEDIKLLANPPPAPGPAPGPSPAPAKLFLLKKDKTGDYEAGFITKEEMKAIEGKCTDSCGTTGVDSSCIPVCQVGIYSCMDNNRKTKDGLEIYEDCEASALSAAKGFNGHWEKTHGN